VVLEAASCPLGIAPEGVLAWLECDSLSRTLPVCSGAHVSIGRDDRCTLVLPDRTVSRYQAHLRVDASGTITLHDEGSSHGTFVNGKRRTRQVLVVGDLIQSGPFEIGVRAVPAGQWARFDPRRRVDASLLMALGSISALTGTIPEVSLAEVLQWIEFTQRSCEMVVSDGMKTGRIIFKAGRPLGASLSMDRGRPALDAMLGLAVGSFAILRDRPTRRDRKESGGAQPVSSTVTSLLLDASRESDERRQKTARLTEIVETLWQSSEG
jgi:hypothetical protein